jgi:hypothetical protein
MTVYYASFITDDGKAFQLSTQAMHAIEQGAANSGEDVAAWLNRVIIHAWMNGY